MERFNWLSISGYPDVLCEVNLKNKTERAVKIMVIKSRQFMVAKSGEVFYTEEGRLKRMDSLEEYQAMVEEEKRVSKLYFEITVGEGNNRTHYKLLLVNRDTVFKVLDEITDMDTRIREQRRYFEEREANNI